MKLSKIRFQLLFIAITHLLVACGPLTQPPSQSIENEITSIVPTDVVTLSVSKVHDLLPERKQHFADALELYAKVNEILPPDQPNKAFNPYKIILTVYFRNTTNAPLVVKLPQTIDFQGAPGGTDIWEMAFFIESLNGEKIRPFLNFSSLPDPEQVSLADFVVIEPKNSYPLKIELDIPYFTYERKDYHGNLLPGSYALFFVYYNNMFGYQLPMTVTPPPVSSFDTLSQAAEWDWEHTMEVDLNAWVGMIVSEETEFTIPDG